MANKRFYWLKLKEDFFADDLIEWLEEQKGGKEYVLFYLKLCLKSLKTNGLLIRNVGSMLVPYNVEKLAEITRTNPDTVIVAMELLKKTGLIEILESGEIYMAHLSDMVGGETNKAAAMRRLRAGNNVTPMLPESGKNVALEYRDKSIEIRDKSIEGENTGTAAADPPPAPKKDKPQKHKYGEYKNVLLTDKELETLKSVFPDWQQRIERLSGYIASSGKRYKSHYATIRNWASRDAESGKPQQQSKNTNPGPDNSGWEGIF